MQVAEKTTDIEKNEEKIQNSVQVSFLQVFYSTNFGGFDQIPRGYSEQIPFGTLKMVKAINPSFYT